MQLGIRCIAKLSLILLFTLYSQYPADAHDTGKTTDGYSKILSALEDSSGNFLLLNIKSKLPLPAPSIHYLPGTAGQTVMVADFHNAVWMNSSQLIKTNNENIESIRLGQFQASPPIFRISIATSNPAILRKIEFRARPSSLVINFGEKETRRLSQAPAPVAAYPALAQKESRDAKKRGELYTETRQKKYTSAGSAQRSDTISSASSPLPAARGKLPFTPGGLFIDASAIPIERSESVPPTAPERKVSEKSSPLFADLSVASLTEKSSQISAEKSTSRKTDRRIALNQEKGTSPSQKQETESVSNVQAVEPAPAPEYKKKRGLAERFRRFIASEFSDDDDEHENSKKQTENNASKPSQNLRGSLATSPASSGLTKPEASKIISSKEAGKIETAKTQRTQSKLAVEPKPPLPAPPFTTTSSSKNSATGVNAKLGTAQIAASSPESDSKKTNSSEGNFVPAGNPQIEYTEGDPYVVRVKLDSPSHISSFRLEDPPRYVIDLSLKTSASDSKMPLPAPDFTSPLDQSDSQQVSGSPPPINSITAPATPSPNPYLKSVRLGVPDPDGKKTRIVLDLNDANARVIEQLDPSGQRLTITLQTDSQAISQTSVKGSLLIIDAGHGGSDPGAQRGDISEKEITLQIAQKLKKIMEERGVRVIMTRADDSTVSLEDRVRITNQYAPDCFVSIHINSLETDRDIQGIETYYNTEQSKALAKTVHEQLVGNLAVPDRYVRKARFYVVNHTSHPAILAEVGFISNKDERDKLISSEYQNKVADSLGQGITLYLASKGQMPPIANRQALTGSTFKSKNSIAAIKSTLARSNANVVKEKVETPLPKDKNNQVSGNKTIAHKVRLKEETRTSKRTAHWRSQIAARRS